MIKTSIANIAIAAEQIGIKQTTVSDFENRPETLFNILTALDLELHVVTRGATLDQSKIWNKEW